MYASLMMSWLLGLLTCNLKKAYFLNGTFIVKVVEGKNYHTTTSNTSKNAIWYSNDTHRNGAVESWTNVSNSEVRHAETCTVRFAISFWMTSSLFWLQVRPIDALLELIQAKSQKSPRWIVGNGGPNSDKAVCTYNVWISSHDPEDPCAFLKHFCRIGKSLF